MQNQSSKKALVAHALLALTIILWGVEFVFVKHLRTEFNTWTIIFFKYFIGLFIIFGVKLVTDRDFQIEKKDFALLALNAFLGMIMYYYCQYSALDYLSIPVVTIIISTTPLFSILVERVLYKTPISPAVILLLFASLIGVVLVIGANFREFLNGQFVGYLFAFVAVVGWIFWLFLPGKIQKKKSSQSIIFWQTLCVVIMLAPYALTHLPDASTFTVSTTSMLLYIGICVAGIGCSCYIYGLTVLGPTITSLYCNFIPPCSAIYSWILLGEIMLPLQMVGGVLILVCGCLIIKLRSKSAV